MFQFTLRSLLSSLTLFAVALAGLVQVPHVLIFAVITLAVALSLFAIHRCASARRRLLAALALAMALASFYLASVGPFIAFSELDRKLTGKHHVGRLARIFVPAMRLNRFEAFRWYVSQWIPQDVEGLHAPPSNEISSALAGTWRTGVANTVSLRADGTGRALDRAGDKPKVLYFEWTSAANEFAIFQYSAKRSASAWFGRELMGYPPTDEFKIIDRSPAQFKLLHKDGTSYSLKKVRDKELESAP